MWITLTDHAKSRITDRGIEPLQIKQVIKNPLQTNKTADGNIKINRKLEDGRVLEVICVKLTKNKFKIITAYYAD